MTFLDPSAAWCLARTRTQIALWHEHSFTYKISSCGGLRSRRLVSVHDEQCCHRKCVKFDTLLDQIESETQSVRWTNSSFEIQHRGAGH